MSKRTPSVTVSPQEIPEVRELLEAEERIQELLATNPEFYKQLCDLVSERNQKLEAAEKVVRAQGVSCGPFTKKSETIFINAEKLFDELGEEGYKAVGGYTETVVEYKVDRTRFLTYLASNQIPEDVAAVCTEKRPSYSSPDAFHLP